MSTDQPRIAIVGGGPSGLTMAVLLHQRNIPCTVFELRAKPTDEDLAKPVGMLDLHEESGLAALKECNLLDEFNSQTGVCAENQVIASQTGDIIYKDDGTGESRPEISRNTLTKILLDKVPANTIKWSHKLTSVQRYTTAHGTTETELDFGPNGKHTFDLVVGTDGAWSRVRTLLTSTKPSYAGIQVITVTIREVTKKYPEIAKYIGPGSFTSLGHKHGIMAQRANQDSARIYVFITTPDENFATTRGLSNSTPTDAKSKLLTDDNLLSSFGNQLKDLVSTACDEESIDNPTSLLDIKPLYALPIGHSWPHATGVTVIGDAAHVMPPFAGEGVNLAMWDALDLSRAIIAASETSPDSAATFQTTLDSLVKSFETVMAERAGEKAQETSDNQTMMFGDDHGAENFVEFFRMAFAQMANQEEEGEKPNVFSE